MTAAKRYWRVPGKVPAGKLAVAAIVVAVGVPALYARGEWWLYAVVAAVVLGVVGWAARDLLAPVRLAADPAGVTVLTGFATPHRLAWSQVQRVRVDVRRRSRMLEVDVGDQLFLFSRYDVDEDLDTVAAELERLRIG